VALIRLSYRPAEADATVTAVRLYTDPARTGTPVFDGVPVLLSGVWTFTPDLADGDYYSAFDVTDSTGSFSDADDFFYVLDGQVAAGSTLLSLAEIRAHLALGSDRSYDRQLVRHLQAAIERITDHVGFPLTPGSVVEEHPAAAVIVLRQARVTAVTSIVDSTGTAVAGYRLTPGGILRTAGGYYGGHGTLLTITYTAGYDALPALVREVLLDLIRLRYETRADALPPGIDVAEADLTPPFPPSDDAVLARLTDRRGPRAG
jgi:hypothetical protein